MMPMIHRAQQGIRCINQLGVPVSPLFRLLVRHAVKQSCAIEGRQGCVRTLSEQSLLTVIAGASNLYNGPPL